MGEEMVGYDDKFLVKRKVGKGVINGRQIKGWQEVPKVLNWRSTYRKSEWWKNFNKLAKMFRNNKLNEIFNTGDLNKKEMEQNHAINTFINSFLEVQNNLKEKMYGNPSEMLETLKIDGVVQNHAKLIYLPETIKENSEDVLRQRIKVGASTEVIEYDSYNISTYEQCVERFLTYLNEMENKKAESLDVNAEEVLFINISHRWEKEYTDKMIAKFKDLSESRFADMWTTMLTLTTYQDSDDKPETPENWQKKRGASWFEAMERLKDSLDKVLKALREIARREIECNFHYCWVVEAHKSGYPHIHIAIFGDVSHWLDDNSNKSRVQELLEEKHDLGKSGVATEFDTKPPSGDGAINELSNYLMKYMKKNFGEIKSEYENEDLSDKDWGTLVYNACMWLSGYRTWDTSTEVGEVMKSDSSESDSNKNYKSVGARKNVPDDADFETEVFSKGSRQLRKRIEKRQEFRNAVKQRKEN